MARFSGKDLVVRVENSASTEGDLTFPTNATINFEYEVHDTEGDVGVIRAILGRLKCDVEVEYEHDDAATGNHAVLSGIFDNAAPRWVRVRPLGTSAGKIQFSVEGAALTFGPAGVRRGDKLVGRARFGVHADAASSPGWGTQ